MTKNKCGYQMHIFVTPFSMQHARVMVLLHGAATSSTISPQMHQQSPADAPPESRGTIRIHWLVTVMGNKPLLEEVCVGLPVHSHLVYPK